MSQLRLDGAEERQRPRAGLGGYARPPGTGPAGETCGSCAFLTANVRRRRYWKCGRTEWTFGAATDIRRRSPACELWAPVGGEFVRRVPGVFVDERG